MGYWPNHFKLSSTVIISKPNKLSYNLPKSFCPIVLLNTLGKLIKKVIGERLQFHIVNNNFIHPSQLGGLKFKSTTNIGVVLMYIIWSCWTRNHLTSTLAFNIAQFFPSLNHHFLTRVIHKVRLDSCVVNFFSNYLINRKTSYKWNSFLSLIFNINVGVDHESALSPILSALYLSSFLYILEKHLKNLKISISIISFVDDGLFISQNKSFNISNSYLFCSYNIITNLLDKFSLIIEHSKTKVFHFSRSQGLFNPPFLNLLSLRGSILILKSLWKYLGFIFDRKLTFYQHINFYSNKVLSSVKCMKMLENSSCSITPPQKCLLYRYCILLIALYGFQLWFYHYAPLLYPLKALGKMQRKAAIWILGAFKTSPHNGIEAIASLISIKLHLQKLRGKVQLWALALPPNHIICSLMNSFFGLLNNHYLSSLANITNHQRKKIKGYLVNTNNRSHGLFMAFLPTHSELAPGFQIIDTFSDRFSFNFCMKEKSNKTHVHQLDSMAIEASFSQFTAIIASKMTLLHLFHIHIFPISLSSRLSIMLHLSQVQKPRCLLLDAASTKPQPELISPRLSSSPTPFMLLRKYLTLFSICFKSNQWLFWKIYIFSFLKTQTT